MPGWAVMDRCYSWHVADDDDADDADDDDDDHSCGKTEH